MDHSTITTLTTLCKIISPTTKVSDIDWSIVSDRRLQSGDTTTIDQLRKRRSRILEKAKGMRLVDGELYKGVKKIVRPDEVHDIIKQTHETAGHPGIATTYSNILPHYEGITHSDICAFMKMCELCQHKSIKRDSQSASGNTEKRKRKRPTRMSRTQPMDDPTVPISLADFADTRIGKGSQETEESQLRTIAETTVEAAQRFQVISTSLVNFKGITLLSVIDCYSRFAWVHFIPEKTGRSVVMLLTNLFQELAMVPTAIYCDRMGMFSDYMFFDLRKEFGIEIKKSTLSAYGRLAREFNSTFLQLLRRCLNNKKSELSFEATVKRTRAVYNQRNHSGLDGLCPVDVWMAGSCRRFYGNNNTVSTSEVKTEQISEIRVSIAEAKPDDADGMDTFAQCMGILNG